MNRQDLIERRARAKGQVPKTQEQQPKTPKIKPNQSVRRPLLQEVEYTPSEEFKKAICDELKRMKSIKAGKIFPAYVTLIPFINHIHKALNSLSEEGKIQVGQTINDKYLDVDLS